MEMIINKNKEEKGGKLSTLTKDMTMLSAPVSFLKRKEVLAKVIIRI